MKRVKVPKRPLELYRDLLLAQRAEILSEFGREGALPEAVRAAQDDQASLLHDQFISLHVKRLDYRKLKEIDAALARIENGEYGVCSACGEEISPKRLAALPWARYCIDCQDSAQAA